jgi:hypothetical protein
MRDSEGNFLETPLSKKRYSICETCESFNSTLKTCKLCNCFMPLKVRVPDIIHKVRCPKGKW